MIETYWDEPRDDPGSILLIASGESNRQVLERRLTSEGYAVTTIETPAQCGDFSRFWKFDLAIVDIGSQETRGLRALKLLRDHFSAADLPMIAIGPEPLDNIVVEALDHGASDFVSTALDFRMLLSRIAIQVSHRKAMAARQDIGLRFRTVIESLPQLVWTCLPDGRCDYVNMQWVAYTGLPTADVLGDGWIQSVHPEDRERVRSCWRTTVDGLGRYDVAYRLKAKDGTYRWFQSRGVAHRDTDGRIIRWLGTCTDIDDQRRTEEDSLEVAELLRSIVDNVGDGLFTIDEHGIIQSVNVTAERQFGYAAEELVGQNVSMLMPEPDRSSHDTYIARYVRTGEARIIAGESRQVGIGRELTALRRDGSVFPIELNVGKFRRGEHLFFTGVVRDITERRKAEESLKSYADRLVSLRAIDRAILAAQESPRNVARIAIHHLARLIPCSAGCVTMLDVEQQTMEIIASHGPIERVCPPGTSLSLSMLEPADAETLCRGEALIVADTSEPGFANQIGEAIRAGGIRSFIMLPLMEHGLLIGSLNLGSDKPSAYSLDAIDVARELAYHLAVAIRQAQLHEEVRAAQGRMEELSRALFRAQEDERRRIARELHDQTGPSLTALKINLQRMNGHGDRESRRLEESLEIVDETLQQVRGMVLNLRPPMLDDLGLASALGWFIERHADRTGIRGRFFADPEDIAVDPNIEITCFRAAQKALTNVARHAWASSFSVELLQHAGGLQMLVRDDGVGFDPAKLPTVASCGLSGMRERIELVGGTLEIQSAPGAGTEIHVNLPNAPPNRSEGS